MKCPMCGNKNEENNKYCSSCGNDFSKNPMVPGDVDFVNSNGELKFGVGVYIWIIICIVFQTIEVIRLINYGIYFMPMLALLSILSNFLLLVLKKKIFYYFIVVVVASIFVANVFVYNTEVITAMMGFLNPIVTYAVISKYWEYMK